jgi:hypothetical protein
VLTTGLGNINQPYICFFGLDTFVVHELLRDAPTSFLVGILCDLQSRMNPLLCIRKSARKPSWGISGF